MKQCVLISHIYDVFTSWSLLYFHSWEIISSINNQPFPISMSESYAYRFMLWKLLRYIKQNTLNYLLVRPPSCDEPYLESSFIRKTLLMWLKYNLDFPHSVKPKYLLLTPAVQCLRTLKQIINNIRDTLTYPHMQDVANLLYVLSNDT